MNFHGGPMVKNSPCNAEDLSLVPGWGTKIPCASGQLKPKARQGRTLTWKQDQLGPKSQELSCCVILCRFTLLSVSFLIC